VGAGTRGHGGVTLYQLSLRGQGFDREAVVRTVIELVNGGWLTDLVRSGRRFDEFTAASMA
jgi:hypothetical protein